jgi:mono/diheme cytochrome c family protein
MTVHTPIEARGSRIPPWALVLALLVALTAGVYLAANFVGENPPLAIPGATPAAVGSGEPDPAVGRALTETATPACSTCHGADLGGSGTFPSLHGVKDGPVSENLQQLAADHPDDWIAIWIAGEPGGPADGLERGGMPVFHEQFSPDQIASIVAYLLTLP